MAAMSAAQPITKRPEFVANGEELRAAMVVLERKDYRGWTAYEAGMYEALAWAIRCHPTMRTEEEWRSGVASFSWNGPESPQFRRELLLVAKTVGEERFRKILRRLRHEAGAVFRQGRPLWEKLR